MLKIGDKKIVSANGKGVELLNDTIIDGSVNVSGDIVVSNGGVISIGGLSSSNITSTQATLQLSKSMNKIVIQAPGEWIAKSEPNPIEYREYLAFATEKDSNTWYINSSYKGENVTGTYRYTNVLPSFSSAKSLDYHFDHPTDNSGNWGSFGLKGIITGSDDTNYISSVYYEISETYQSGMFSPKYTFYLAPLFSSPVLINIPHYYTVSVHYLVFDCEDGEWYAMLMDYGGIRGQEKYLETVKLGDLSYYYKESAAGGIISGVPQSWFSRGLSDWCYDRYYNHNATNIEIIKHLDHDFVNTINYYPILDGEVYKDAVDEIKAGTNTENTTILSGSADSAYVLCSGYVPCASYGELSEKRGIYLYFNSIADGENTKTIHLPNLGRYYTESNSSTITITKK